MKRILLILFFTISTISFSEKLTDFKLKDQYNISHTLTKYREKTVLLVFWGSYCSLCKDELPIIEKVYRKYGKNKENVIVLGINKEDSNKIKNFSEKNKYEFPTVSDQDIQIIKQYSVEFIPTIIFINPNGEIVEKITGSLEKNQIEEIITKINKNF